MKPILFLRIASVLTLIHCIAHTIRGVISGPTHGAEEIAVIETMKSHSFNFGGSARSYWDFHLGYGWFLTAILLAHALLFWYLARLSRTSSIAVRPILALFCLNYLMMAIAAWKFFALGPVIIELLIAATLAAALASTAVERPQ
ncbi:MAG TPA: hypothetical protein VHM88_06775 [Candidatus Acidoferrales bacterium]|nr:hypothetical protein [Candidatus Acidoferrales bacterium]